MSLNKSIKIALNRSLGLVFFIVATPIGLIMRFLGKDLLKIKFKEI